MTKIKNSLTIVWTRIKKPLIPVLFILLSIACLSFLNKSKANYDKTKNKPIVITDDIKINDYEKDCQTQVKDSYYALPANCLSNKIIKADIQTQNANSKISDKKHVIQKSIEEIKYEEFKNKNELVNSINDAILKERDLELRSVFNSLILSFINEHKERKAVSGELLLVENKIDEYAGKIEISRFINFNKDKLNENDIKTLRNIETNNKDKKFSKQELIEQTNKFYIIQQTADNKSSNLDTLIKTYKESTLDFAGFIKGNYDLDKTKDGKSLTHQVLINLKDHKEIKDREFTIKEFKTVIEDAFVNHLEKTEPAKIKVKLINQIERIGNSYSPILKKVFHSKDKLVEISKNEKLQVWLDEKGKLHIFYTLAVITLNAIIVFTLLFIIITPLSKLFFLASSSDAIIGEASNFIALKKSSALSSGVIAGAIPALTAIGIGAAAITANQFPNLTNETALLDSPAVFESSQTSQNPRKQRPIPLDKNLYRILYNSDFGGNLDENSLQAIAANIATLENSVNKLNQTVGGKTFGTNFDPLPIYITIPNSDELLKSINGNLSSISGRIGENKDNKLGTLFGDLGTIKTTTSETKGFFGNQTDSASEDGLLFGRINYLQNKIGKPTNRKDATLFENIDDISTYVGNDPNKADNGNLLGKLNRISTVLGTNKYFPDDTNSPKDLASISDRIGFYSTNNSTNKTNSSSQKNNDESLMNISKLNQEEIAKIKKETNTIQRNQLGRGDKNFISQAKSVKRIFKSERYQISTVAYQVIEEEIMRKIKNRSTNKKFSETQKQKIESMLSKLKTISEDEKYANQVFTKKDLSKLLTCCGRDNWAWKKWKDLILRITLVRRY